MVAVVVVVVVFVVVVVVVEVVVVVVTIDECLAEARGLKAPQDGVVIVIPPDYIISYHLQSY